MLIRKYLLVNFSLLISDLCLLIRDLGAITVMNGPAECEASHPLILPGVQQLLAGCLVPVDHRYVGEGQLLLGVIMEELGPSHQLYKASSTDEA